MKHQKTWLILFLLLLVNMFSSCAGYTVNWMPVTQDAKELEQWHAWKQKEELKKNNDNFRTSSGRVSGSQTF